MSTLQTRMQEERQSENERSARFALARAQTAAYYAHRHLIEHPGNLEAQVGYREANRRCDAAVAALRVSEKVLFEVSEGEGDAGVRA